MQITGEQKIEAAPETVWAALNDAEALRRSIPGCETLMRTGANEFTGAVRAKVGPVSATFKGKVELTDLDPPHGYTLTGRGQGGAAGFAKGDAKVRLVADGEGTRLTYVATVDVGGKLASVGGRLIESVSRRMADDFFGRFSKVVTGEVAVEEALEGASIQPREGALTGRLPVIDRLAWFLVGLAVGAAATLYFIRP
ncbi:MAG: carbon monoxide dehydrogenase subunit G [Rhodomicrobiaceae bacterium]